MNCILPSTAHKTDHSLEVGVFPASETIPSPLIVANADCELVGGEGGRGAGNGGGGGCFLVLKQFAPAIAKSVYELVGVAGEL